MNLDIETGFLRRPRRAALIAITTLVSASSLVSFGESYRGLFLWAHHHGLAGIWVAIWPLMVDTFIAVGELSLFVALVDRWKVRSRTSAWAVTLTGLVVSVAGNIGHVSGSSLANRATAAVPPLAAAAALAVGLGVLKRVVGSRAAEAQMASDEAADGQRLSPADTEAAILAAMASDPDVKTDKLAERLGVSTRTVRRHKARLKRTQTA